MEQENQDSQEKKQEMLFRLSMFEQQAHSLQEQIEAVEQGIGELGSLNFGLDELTDGFGKEILAPVGRGIFVGATVSSEALTVDVGGKNFVKKSIPETKEIIEEQIKKLAAVKGDLNDALEKMSDEMEKTLKEFQE